MFNQMGGTLRMVIMAIIVVFVIYSIFSFFSFTGEIPVIVGKMNGKHGKTIEQDPNNRNAKPIKRSNNAATGLEFTWSVWVNVSDLDYGGNGLVFNKGSSGTNCPGLYIDGKKNNFKVQLDTFSGQEEVVINDFTLNKWINVIIRCENLYLDVYVNGTIVKRHVCSSLPKQNYGNVNVATGGGFSGSLSDLYYWNYALGTSKIDSIIELGPTLMEFNPFSTSLNPFSPSSKNSKGKGSILGSIGDWIHNLFHNLFHSSHSKSSSSTVNGKPYYYSLRWFLQNDSPSATTLDYGGL
jgi:hypothetical protein